MIAVGQLYQVTGHRLFVIESIGDHAWPITLREVARSRQHEQEIEGVLAGYARVEQAWCNEERCKRWRAMSTWTQDAEWFEKRGDVVLWAGSVAEWVEAKS